MTRKRLLKGLVFLLIAGCSESRQGTNGPDVQIDTIGDTIVVHTRAGQEWPATGTLEPRISVGELDGEVEFLFGNIRSIALDISGNVYVLDGQTRDIRSFNTSGEYIRTYGRAGQGPGELMRPEAMGVSPSGRVLVRDPRNGRVQVFGGAGDPVDEWPLLNPNAGFGDPLWIDDAERTYVVTKSRQGDLMTSETIVILVSGDGIVLDTIPVPTSTFVAATLEAVSVTANGTSRSSGPVPFTPQASWAVHRNGSLVIAISDQYRIDLVSGTGSVLRIGRDYDPIPVTAEEREFYERQTTMGMRRMDPNWRWTGPEIPTEKPPFQEVYVGIDGKLWVWLFNNGIERSNPNFDPNIPDGPPETMWVEGVSFDVFESDGTYLGRVGAPSEFSMYPRPVFDVDGAWGVTYDGLGVPRVTRFELMIPEEVL